MRRAQAILENAQRLTAISLAGLVNVLDLEMIVIGGGVASASPDYVEQISQLIRQYLMTEEAKRIAWSYPDVKIVQGADPKVVGFDEARNKSLNFCTMEWVLWIDCDEKLIGIEKDFCADIAKVGGDCSPRYH